MCIKDSCQLILNAAQALFRPVSMCVPDLNLICEIMLMAEGFQQSKVLSRKFVILYKLCEDLLSKSRHYDWKLRAIKTTLYVAGSMKRQTPELSEDRVSVARQTIVQSHGSSSLMKYALIFEVRVMAASIFQRRNSVTPLAMPWRIYRSQPLVQTISAPQPRTKSRARLVYS